jgi:hypothetical protein
MRDRYWIHVRGRKIRVSWRMQHLWQRTGRGLFGGTITSTRYGDTLAVAERYARLYVEEYGKPSALR